MFKFYWFVFLIGITQMAIGQSLRFADIPVERAITKSYIFDILQDKNGFIWIGSVEGLGRYDGHELKEFKFIKNDHLSLCSNSIQSLYAARDGKIWIGTKAGLSVYDPESEEIQCLFKMDDSNDHDAQIILDVIEDRFGFIWYATYNGVYRLNPKNQSVDTFLPDASKDSSIHNKITFSIFEDKNGVLWFAGRKGISYYKNDGSEQFVNILPNANNPYALQHERFFCFTQTDNGQLWLGGDTGLYEIKQDDDDLWFINHTHRKNDPNSLSYDFVNHLLADKDNIWVATWAGGLNKISNYDKETGLKFEHFRLDKNDPYSISTDEVTVTLRDSSGVLWVGTGFGLMQSSPSTNKFGNAIASPNVNTSISTNKVQCTLVDSHGNLWVGTDDGLNFQKANDKGQADKFKIYRHSPNNNNSLCHDNIFDLYEDSSHRLWIATYSGLSIIDLNDLKEDPKFKTLKFKKYPHNWVYNILETDKDKYWLSTYGKLAKMYLPPHAITPELDIYDMDPGNPSALSNATTYQSCKDGKGRIWIATYYGLSLVNTNGDSITFSNFYPDRAIPNSLSDVSINCLFLDKNDHLWVGTKQGLNLVVEQPDGEFEFITLDEQNGLPNSVIKFIEEDDEGKLWIGTGDGLVHFDPQKALANLDPILNIYNKHDGFGSNLTALRSSSKDQQGNIYFGTDGLNYFNPKEIQRNTNVPPLTFTKIKVHNKLITPASHPKILKNSVTKKDAEVNLEWADNMIEIYFTAIDYANPIKNQYKYKLEGVNTDWVYSGNQNFASYTNLSAGSYIFKVIGSNNDGLWNEAPISLLITVAPHWSKSNIAYALYALIALLIIGLYQNWRKTRAIEKIERIRDIEVARFEEREQLRKKNAADFHDELGHRLTKIGLFLEIAGKHTGANTELVSYLEKVKINTKGLSDGLKDLIWSLDPGKDTLLDTINRIQEFGDQLFEYSNINFATNPISHDLNKIKLSATERKHILLIFKEAMNNTLKYSRAEHCIFSVEKIAQAVHLKFQDDGIGFEKSTIHKGQGLKNIHNRSKEINGTMILSAAPHNGTAIELVLQMNDRNETL